MNPVNSQPRGLYLESEVGRARSESRGLYLESEVGHESLNAQPRGLRESLNAQPRGLRESMLYAKFPDTLLSQ